MCVYKKGTITKGTTSATITPWRTQWRISVESRCCIFERPHRVAVYPSNMFPRMPLLNLHAQQFINLSSHVSCHSSWGLNIIHVSHISLLISTSLPQGHTTSVMHNTFMTSGAVVRAYTNIPLHHVYLFICHLAKIGCMYPNMAISVPNPSCYFVSAVLTLNALHRWSYVLYLVTEASLVGLKGWLRSGFCIPVDH